MNPSEPTWASIEDSRAPAPQAEQAAHTQHGTPAWTGTEAGAGTERTGPLPLHPMTLSDVLDGSFKLLKANARAVFLVVAASLIVPQVAIAYASRDLVSLGIVGLASNPADGETVVLMLVASAVSTLGAAFAAGAICRIVAASYLGRELSAGPALRVAVRRSPALLAAFFLVHLLELSGLVLCGVGVLATMPFFMTMYVLVTPVIVVEETGPLHAMGRSWRLVRPRFWAVLGTAMLAGFVSWVLSQIISAGPTGIAFVLGGSLAWILVAAGGVIATVVSTPIVAITATLLYFDARIRHEGFDLQLMAAQIDRGARPV